MTDVTPFWLAGQAETGTETLSVINKWSGVPVGEAAVPTPAQAEAAIAAAVTAAPLTEALPAHVRAAALDHVSASLGARAEEVAQLITAENGKPIMWARVEVKRAVSTFRWAAEEARRFSGELQRLDTEPGADGRLALIRRFPRGPVLGVAPFNFPLNLVAHKLAPAIAVGAPIILKPAPATPLSSLLLGSLLAETELPAGAFSVLPMPNDRAPALVADPRLPVVSFTGSVTVGWEIRRAVPDKQVILELGGNAGVIIAPDWTDLERAAERIALFANYQGGQSCIAVQRVFIDQARREEFASLLVGATRALVVGDPRDEQTQVGPLINEAAAQRVGEWVDEAVTAGARVLVGGERSGSTYAPTIVVDAPVDAKVNREEVFGPVLTLASYNSVADAFAQVNDSPFGLQAGVFTRDSATAFAAHRALRVGGVVIGDVPSYRADQMPYGGTKVSGFGREGVRFAMDDYTETRVLVLTGIDL